MKNYMKGVITGVLIGTAISAIPAIAENIDVLFNIVRVNINGVDQIQWDEKITLADGSKAPSSILYDGTTYLPIRKIGEITGNNVYWNGDSKTVSIINSQRKNKITEKPDKNGNIWEYYIYYTTSNTESGNKNYQYYLDVKDKTRRYERTYQILNDKILLTDDSLYFVKEMTREQRQYTYLTKLVFNNDENSQDGEELYNASSRGYVHDSCFDGNYLFLCGQSPGNGAHGFIGVYNYVTGTYKEFYDDTRTREDNISVENINGKIIIHFTQIGAGASVNCEIPFNTETETFGDIKITEDVSQ